jgi:alpha-tubulin suppressor-like RCC1 family protein
MSVRTSILLCAAPLVMSGVAVASCVGDSETTTPTSDAGGAGDAAPDAFSPPLDAGADVSPSDAGCGDTTTDTNNCGACGHKCTTGFSCSASHCGNEVTEVAAGGQGACAVLHDGSLYCWGDNQTGELAVAPSANDQTCSTSFHCRSAPTKIAGIGPVAHASVSPTSTCALLQDGSVWCWGDNSVGALGHDPSTDTSCQQSISDPTPVKCSPTPQKVQISGDPQIGIVIGKENAFCAISKAGNVYCWGSNTYELVNTSASTFVATATEVTQFSANATQGSLNFHACVLESADGGGVMCWGEAFAGQLGHSGVGCAGNGCDPTPKVIAGTTGATFVGTADSATCVIIAGVVKCLGSGGLGELGDGPDGSTGSQALLSATLPSNIVSLSGLYNGFLARGSDGKIWAWGHNEVGELGTGVITGLSPCQTTATCIFAPVENVALEGTIQISTGNGSGVGLKSDGSVVAWGQNDHAQLAHFPGDKNDQMCGPSQILCSPGPVVVTGLP